MKIYLLECQYCGRDLKQDFEGFIHADDGRSPCDWNKWVNKDFSYDINAFATIGIIETQDEELISSLKKISALK